MQSMADRAALQRQDLGMEYTKGGEDQEVEGRDLCEGKTW